MVWLWGIGDVETQLRAIENVNKKYTLCFLELSRKNED
jgi:hypothetical protein